MGGDDRLRQIEQQLVEVERSSISLRQSIDGLRVPLDVLAEVQTEQREIRRQAESAERKAAAAQDLASIRDYRTKRVLRLVAAGGISLLLLVTFLTFTSLIQHVNSLLAAQDAARYAGCLTRNEAVTVEVNRERTLAEVEHLGPKVAAAHIDSAAALSKLLIDCGQYRVKR